MCVLKASAVMHKRERPCLAFYSYFEVIRMIDDEEKRNNKITSSMTSIFINSLFSISRFTFNRIAFVAHEAHIY